MAGYPILPDPSNILSGGMRSYSGSAAVRNDPTQVLQGGMRDYASGVRAPVPAFDPTFPDTRPGAVPMGNLNTMIGPGAQPRQPGMFDAAAAYLNRPFSTNLRAAGAAVGRVLPGILGIGDAQAATGFDPRMASAEQGLTNLPTTDTSGGVPVAPTNYPTSFRSVAEINAGGAAPATAASTQGMNDRGAGSGGAPLPTLDMSADVGNQGRAPMFGGKGAPDVMSAEADRAIAGGRVPTDAEYAAQAQAHQEALRQAAVAQQTGVLGNLGVSQEDLARGTAYGASKANNMAIIRGGTTPGTNIELPYGADAAGGRIFGTSSKKGGAIDSYTGAGLPGPEGGSGIAPNSSTGVSGALNKQIMDLYPRILALKSSPDVLDRIKGKALEATAAGMTQHLQVAGQIEHGRQANEYQRQATLLGARGAEAGRAQGLPTLIGSLAGVRALQNFPGEEGLNTATRIYEATHGRPGYINQPTTLLGSQHLDAAGNVTSQQPGYATMNLQRP